MIVGDVTSSSLIMTNAGQTITSPLSPHTLPVCLLFSPLCVVRESTFSPRGQRKKVSQSFKKCQRHHSADLSWSGAGRLRQKKDSPLSGPLQVNSCSLKTCCEKIDQGASFDTFKTGACTVSKLTCDNLFTSSSSSDFHT